MDTFASLDELKLRLDWTLDDDEERIAEAALEDASDMARYHGRDWTKDNAPRMVRTLVLKACKRYMSNPEGYTQSRAGDETLAWNDKAGENAGTVYFTREEIDLLRAMSGRAQGGFAAAEIVAWGPRRSTRQTYRDTGYVPVQGGGDPFPMFADPKEPW